MNELQKRFSYRALNQFYRENRRRFKSSPSAGVDRVKFAEFDRNAASIIRRLAAEIEAGSFRFRKLRPFPLEKAGGGVRWLCIPTIEDRLVQRALVDTIVRQYKDKLITNYSFGSISRADVEGERSATRVACDLRSSNPWCVKADVAKFFDNISRDDLVKKIRSFVRHRSLHPLLQMAVGNEIEVGDARQREEIEASGLTMGRGVRQGMPLSPLLAHLYLVDFDRWTYQSGIRCVRYVDDLLLLAETEGQVTADFEKVKKRLEVELELTIHPLGSEKTQLVRPTRAVEYLGIEIAPHSGGYQRKIPSAAFAGLGKRVDDRLDVPSERFEPNHILKSVSFIANMNGAYKAAYGDLSNWPQFSAHLASRQVRAIKLFRSSVAAIGKIDSRILAAFGVKRRQSTPPTAPTSPPPAGPPPGPSR